MWKIFNGELVKKEQHKKGNKKEKKLKMGLSGNRAPLPTYATRTSRT